MRSLGQDASLLPIALSDDGVVRVEDEPIGRLDGFRFTVDPAARHAEGKLLLAAAEKALPRLLGERAGALAAANLAGVVLEQGVLRWQGRELAKLHFTAGSLKPRIETAREIAAIPDAERKVLSDTIERWLATTMQPLASLGSLMASSRDPAAGSEARALLLALIAGHGIASREEAGIAHLPKDSRPFLRKVGVTFGALDIFAPALLKPAPRQLLARLGIDRRPLDPAMLSVIPGGRRLPVGYRPAGNQAVRIDLAERIFRAAHEARDAAQRGNRRKRFTLDLALATSIGLAPENILRLLGQVGFRMQPARPMAEGVFGPSRPDLWEWRPQHLRQPPRKVAPAPSLSGRDGNAFAALAGLVR